MCVLFTNLNEDRSAGSEQIASDDEPVAEISQVRVDSELPRISEGLDLLDLPSRVLQFAVGDVSISNRGLPIRLKFDPVGRIDVDHLHLVSQALALGQAGHDIQGVAKNHSVRPVGAVLVELNQLHRAKSVKVVEKGQLRLRRAIFAGLAKVLDQHARIDLLLNVDRWRLNLEISTILVVLSSPYELRV